MQQIYNRDQPTPARVIHKINMRNKQMQVTCIKCNKIGTLGINQSKSNGHIYKYYGIQHYDSETKKRSWCYVGPEKSLPEQYKTVIHKEQSLCTDYTQIHEIPETFNSHVICENNANMRWTGRDLNPRLPECKSGVHATELPAQLIF